MSGAFRLPPGLDLLQAAAVDRNRPLSFRFNGKAYRGLRGDTLASALLANGVRLVGRSFKYHRPRGILSAGAEEPSALVHLRSGARQEPNIRATQIELFEGLSAASQNCWPSVDWDVSSVNDLLSPFLPAGFYYKTFMWPPKGWMFYERFIRKAAGMGTATREADPDRYEKMNAHCDLLIVGAGPAGLAAAAAAAESGARVMLVEEQAALAQSYAASDDRVEGQSLAGWGSGLAAQLAGNPKVTLLPRCSAFGIYDGGLVGLVEQVNDFVPEPDHRAPRLRLWKVRAKGILLATGAIERPLVFGNNDLPGVMLAGAVRRYLRQYAVLPGREALVFTTGDEAYATAFDLKSAGANVTLVDARAEPAQGLRDWLRDAGIEVISGAVVTRALGGRQLTGADVATWDSATQEITGGHRRLPCDLLAVAGGWQPCVHLHAHLGQRPAYAADAQAVLPPRDLPAHIFSAGACNGTRDLGACIAEGEVAAGRALGSLGLAPVVPRFVVAAQDPNSPCLPLWEVPGAGRAKKFVDIQDDVTAKDIRLAHREGYVSVEHLKRYTTLGMGTDQGKTSNLNGLAIMAQARGEEISQVGTTTFRPPYTALSMGALTGAARGRHFHAIRRTPMHDWHLANGGRMVEAGLWMRPRWYESNGKTITEAYIKETDHVRQKVGMVDVSTLGKIDVQGPDAGEFLNRVYVNGFGKLPIGKARYGLMLREDGHVMDDGTTSRLDEHHFYMTTTTANAAKVMAHMEYYLNVVWPDLKVRLTSISDQWGGMALSGPLARTVLESCVEGQNLSDEGLPFMGVAWARIAGHRVLLLRISFSGELAYEIHADNNCCEAVWCAVLEAGRPHDIIPYGTEALGALRIEKGHVAGPELDGRTTLADIGLERMASSKKHFIGEQLAKRPAMTDPKRPSLVGILPKDPKAVLKGGGLLVKENKVVPHSEILGHLTSFTYSPVMKSNIALALVKDGKARLGENLYVADAVRNSHQEVTIVDPVFYDPKGERLHV
jgi:sarcosine oxidase subunit alpha